MVSVLDVLRVVGLSHQREACVSDLKPREEEHQKDLEQAIHEWSPEMPRLSEFRPLIVFFVSIFSLLASSAIAKPALAFEAPFDDGKERIWLNRQMIEKNNDNRDPNWDWTANVTYTLESTNGTFSNVRLPYFASSGPAAALLNDSNGRDIWPVDGWELVLRDFGPGVVTPYYMLYNKYRGILRFFYFSTLPQSFTSAIARLSYQTQSASRSGAHFTLIDSDRYVDDYDPTRSQLVIGAVTFQQWAFFDFDVSGFDPNIGLKDDPTFIIEIAGVTETDLTSEGEVDLTTGPVSTTKSGGGLTSPSDLKNVLKRHKDVAALRNVAEANEAGVSNRLEATGAEGLTPGDWIRGAGVLVKLFDLIIGGGSSQASLPFPLATHGTVTLNGTLTTQTPLYTLLMRIPGGNHLDPANDASSNVLPLYDIPLGLLNVSSAPIFSGTMVTDSPVAYPLYPWHASVTTSSISPLEIVYNEHVFDTAEFEVSWAAFEDPEFDYVPLTEFNSGWTGSFSGGGWSDIPRYIDLTSGDQFSRFAIHAELTPFDNASDLEPVTLFKNYTTTTDIDVVYECSGWFCFPGVYADSDATAASIDELVAELERDRLDRPQAAPTTLDEYVDDYVLILASLVRSEVDLTTESSAGRRAYREHLASSGTLEGWSEADLRLIESAAWRKLVSKIRRAED